MGRHKKSKPTNQKRSFGIWDEALLHKPPPSRYMELRALLLNPNRPSIHITTAELAVVVHGREDISLPDWSTNELFEAELESLISDNSAVSICWNCDSVISFFHDPKLGKQMVPELIVVQHLEKVPCPECGSLRIAFYDPEVLKTGDAVQPHDCHNGEQILDKAEPVVQPEESPHISTNEKFLESLIRTRYEAPQGNRTDAISLSKDTIDRVSKKYKQTVMTWEKLSGLPSIDPNALNSLQEFPFISLRPHKAGGRPSLLGHTWHMVQELLSDDYLELREVAMGLAFSRGISASGHLGESGEKAIVLELGLFSTLPRLNHLLSLMFDTDMLLRPGKPHHWTIDDIAANVICKILDPPVNPAKAKAIPPLNYESKDDFLRSHIITEAQIIFVILHELGHFADWQAYHPLNHHQIENPQERSDAIEAWSDKWAMELIFERGKVFHQSWLHCRSIFWLFEYWHVLHLKLRHAAKMTLSKPRSRWDHITEIIKEKEEVDLESITCTELRDILDSAIVKFLSNR